MPSPISYKSMHASTINLESRFYLIAFESICKPAPLK